MNAYAKIHVLKRNAGLDEDSYRDLLERETGKRSSKGMTTAEQRKAIQAIERLLPEGDAGNQGTARAIGPFAKKLQALWIAGYNLGVVDARSDKAMMDFLKRQTGLDHHRFLQDSRDATRAIDALKLWIRRETGNDALFSPRLSSARRQGRARESHSDTRLRRPRGSYRPARVEGEYSRSQVRRGNPPGYHSRRQLGRVQAGRPDDRVFSHDQVRPSVPEWLNYLCFQVQFSRPLTRIERCAETRLLRSQAAHGLRPGQGHPRRA
ncbi:regulatory protein GemA [uncultured Roseibium sp.]|uniref:regulatory protein GemA n=1 Tax=uncultured Roseibium sp. TaxID=1936171 RepID=UPI002608E49B|nr:regulatory protein GemA [uncultured Roseibium sp.]